MFGKYNNIAIKGIESVTPKKEIKNDDYVSYLGEKKIAKQVKLTGIQSCCVAEEEETTESICVEAAQALMSRLNWTKDEIRGVILVTQTPSYVMPATAFVIQKQLGISEDSIVFDVNLGCSGYTSGLSIVGGLLSNLPIGSKMLLLVGDTLTKCLGEQDIQNKMLFGDAGTATAIEVVEGSTLCYMQKSMGEKYDKIFMNDSTDCLHMDGMEVFHYTINYVVEYVKEFMEKAELTDDDIDYYVFHQAQKHIVDSIADFCGIAKEKILISYDRYGNTAGASIPLTMTVNSEHFCNGRNKVLMCGFGVGLSCGIVYGQVNV